MAPVRLSFKTDSIAAVAIELMRRGVRVTTADSKSGTRSLHFADPFGNELQVNGALADSLRIPVNRIGVDGPGVSIGSVYLHFGAFGMVLTPDLKGLSPGRHSIHVHEYGNCGPALDGQGKSVPGLAAGEHYHPNDAAWMGSPVGEGTLGDLPDIFVEIDGSSTAPVVAPEIRRSDVAGRTIMIHLRGDNGVAGSTVMDHTMDMKMSGNPRMVCGVVGS